MGDFLKRSEQVVLTSPTDLKNRSGTLYLTNERLHWVETTGNHEETIYFSDIRSTLVSNATSKRVCLKLVTKQDPLGSVFYFTSANARAELDNFKDTLCKLSKEKGNRGSGGGGGGGGSGSGGSDRESNEEKKEEVPGLSGLDINPQQDRDVHRSAPRSPHKPKEDPSQHQHSHSHHNPPHQPQQQQPQQQPQQHRYNSLRQSDEHIDPPFLSPTNNNPTANNLNTANNNNNYNNNYMTGTTGSKHTMNHNNTTTNTTSKNNKLQSSPQKDPFGFGDSSEEDEFFAIKEDGNNGGGGGGYGYGNGGDGNNRNNNNNNNGGSSSSSSSGGEIEVRDPQKEVDNGSKGYVSYEIVFARNGQPPQKLRRRYKDFEWLYNHIVSNYQHRTTIPAFPSKSILKSIGSSLPYMATSDAEFTLKRCQGLDKFMKACLRSPILLQSKAVHHFLSGSPIEHEPSIGGVVGFLGKVESHLSGSSGVRRLDDIDIADQNFSDVEMDYKYVRELMMRWDLTPKKLPFEKFLVVVLGTTSAGKSAFVNHFYGLQVKRSAVGQMDTHFTLVETLPKEKFAEYSDKASSPRPNFTDEELARKITGDVYADPRYGYVFYYLDTFKTLSRYESQFTNYAQYISNYGLVRSIIVNEDYLRGSPEKIQLAKRTILLDSPGFDYTKENEHAMEKFLGNLKILQLFYSMSDLSLFMTPATHINMVSNQIATLELSVLYSLHGAEYVDKLLHEILTAPTSAAGNAPTHLIPSIVDIKNYVVQRFMHTSSGLADSKKAEYKGTVVWDKIRFVLTKIDEAFINQPGGGNLNEQFYELGRLLGKNLTYLEAPTFSQCLAIGLPEHQQQLPKEEVKTGDLKALMDLIRSLNSESSYMSRLEASVQMMCLELQSAIKGSWATWISPKQWMSSDTTQLQDIYRRSCLRLKKMSTSGGGGIPNLNNFLSTSPSGPAGPGFLVDDDYAR